MAARQCLDCGTFTDGATRCPACTAAIRRRVDGRRGNTTQRGYGAEHQAERARLLPKAIGKPCPRCGQPMLDGQALDLGHAVAIAHGGRHGPRRIEHALCNRSAGGRTRRTI